MNDYVFKIIDKENNHKETFIKIYDYIKCEIYLVYYKDMYCDEHFDYIKKNFKRFKEIFIVNDSNIKFFKDLDCNYYRDAFYYQDHTMIINLQNKFINLMKTTIEKDDLQKQINSNCGVNKVKRKKRVM